MHENSGNSVIYYAHYTEGGVNKTGLTVTITVYEVIRDGTKTEVVTDGACTEIGDGLYRYLLASGTVDAAAEYVAVFHTATDTVDAQDIPAMWVIDRAGTEKLDTGITLADDAITASKFDESTAFPLKSADTGATQVARVGADSDTLETLSDQLDAAATASALSTLDGKVDTIDNFLDTEIAAILEDTGTTIPATLATLATAAALDAVDNYIDTEVAAIKAKTDLIPASPAEAGEYTAAIAAIKADLDNPDQYKADVSTLATTAHVQEVENKVDLIDVTTVANSGKIDAVDTKVSAIDTDTIMSFMIDGFTFEQIVQIMASVLAGKLTRYGDTLTFRDLADTVNRVVAKTDANKQRTTMTYTV